MKGLPRLGPSREGARPSACSTQGLTLRRAAGYALVMGLPRPGPAREGQAISLLSTRWGLEKSSGLSHVSTKGLPRPGPTSGGQANSLLSTRQDLVESSGLSLSEGSAKTWPHKTGARPSACFPRGGTSWKTAGYSLLQAKLLKYQNHRLWYPSSCTKPATKWLAWLGAWLA